MKHAAAGLIAFALIGLSVTAYAEPLSREAAVEVAERFILENGYTDAPSAQAKEHLDHESIERASARAELLASRFNSLKAKAIGIRQGRKGSPIGWSVAFDYAVSPEAERPICRVVTMAGDGSELRVEHVDGFRSFFAGFAQ